MLKLTLVGLRVSTLVFWMSNTASAPFRRWSGDCHLAPASSAWPFCGAKAVPDSSAPALGRNDRPAET